MPKATKLHLKGKANSIQKPCKVDKDSSDNTDPEESMRQFQLELCWCIQQLERTLAEKKVNEKQLQETWKVLTVLKNNNQPLIRKRQLMRTHFGDYRAKMAAEEKKLAKMTSKMKITEVQEKPKATFLRKSAFLTTGDSSFRFNFNLASEHIDNGNKIETTDKESGEIVDNAKSNLDLNSEETVKQTDTATKSEQVPKPFKFAFTKSEFKFNFNTEE